VNYSQTEDQEEYSENADTRGNEKGYRYVPPEIGMDVKHTALFLTVA